MTAKNSLVRLYQLKHPGRWTAVVGLLALLVFSVSGWAWWHVVRSDPARTFYATLDNSLKTRAVTRTVTQAAAGQSLEQSTGATFAPHHQAHGTTTINQQGEVSATIKTETISSPKEDYVRYVTIETSQKSATGQSLDFSKVINVWGKNQASDQAQPVGELYGESVLGVVPLGSLAHADRAAVLEIIRDQAVYAFDEQKVVRKLEHGRPVYIYDVTVKPEAYVAMLKRFGKAIGLKQLETVDPSSYRDTEPLHFKLTIDVWSRQLTSVVYEDGERTEHMKDHGVARHVPAPKESISFTELQSRLQSIQ